MILRKFTKNHNSSPNDEALATQFYPTLQNLSQKWTTDPGMENRADSLYYRA